MAFRETGSNLDTVNNAANLSWYDDASQTAVSVNNVKYIPIQNETVDQLKDRVRGEAKRLMEQLIGILPG